ncbi:hypothetical protein [Geobacillus sp. YF-1]|uniref:hypothetical protein n=1 Tax=Geobacillus sp. YF-1 TaxID=3457480 RepID=UPI0040464719
MLFLVVMFASGAHAESFNGIEDSKQEETAVIETLFDGVGVDKEAADTASMYMSPIVELVNLIVALILGVASLGMFFITGLDLLYIAVPPLRNLLNPSNSSSIGRWISDEALAVVGAQNSSQPQVIAAPQSDVMGMTGYGAGMMGGIQREPDKPKVMIINYLKKRVYFLFMFGVCVVLLSTTIFTDLGMKLGSWILTRLSGI